MTVAQIFSFVLMLALGSVMTKSCEPSVKLPYGCRCMKYSKLYVTVRCKNQGDKTPFSTIPSMPNNTDHLIIEGFRFANLTKDIFKNLRSLSSLHKLSLLDNNIINISRDALSELKHLQGLEIVYEIQVSRREISEMLSNISGNISSLKFSHNAWDEPPEFFGLRDAPIRELILSNNYFRLLDGHWFTDLTKLRKLDVSFNGITDIHNLSGLANITNLFLSGNWFKEFPEFCNFTLQKLTCLHFQYNKLTEFKPTYFQCLPNLETLNLNGHAIRKLYNNTFTNLTSLRQLYMQRLAGQLFHIEPEAFKSNSLKILIFTDNGFFFRNSSKEPSFEIFKYCQNLTVLNISSNNIELNENEFITMIKPLDKLQMLGIRTTRLYYLPRHLSRHLPMLKKLDASDNYLNGSWDGKSVFGTVPTLQYLDLSDNSIERITEYNFPLTLLNGLHDSGLNLSYNKFSCNCDDALWFYNWMHANKNKLAYLGNITCGLNVPLHASTKKLFYLTEKELCPMNPAVLIAIISSGTALLVIFITLTTLYKLRWHIRHWLYIIKYKNKGYEILPDDPDFKYDVFLVYADEDNKFIFEIAVPYLEGKGYSLCVRCRDFEIGKLYCDNIVDNMNLSRRILLVLSNNFAKSKWCEFQMNFAYNRCLDEKTNNIIVAVWEEISYKYLSNTLKVLLTSYDYALWSKSDATGRSLFWGKILRKLQFQSDDTECANGLLGVLQ